MREVEENEDDDTEIDEVFSSPPVPKESLPPEPNNRRLVPRLAAKQALVQLESSGVVIVDDDDDDQDEVTCRPVKRSRRGRPSPSLLTTSDGYTDQKQIITLSLVCLQMDCPEMMLAEGELNQHMWEKHSIGRHRCLLKDCGQSFDNHIVECRGQVSNHYSAVHRALNFQCPVCDYQATTKYSLKVHQRIHLGIKPYQCKWSDCHFAAVSKGDTVKHIRACHLNGANPNILGDHPAQSQPFPK